MKLLIVESPNKIKKLKSLLGSGYEVAASVGHIRDLPAKELGINRQAGYKMDYQVYSEKQDVVKRLHYLVSQIGKENVLLATDPDREGEAIAYHLSQVLQIPLAQAQRVTFQEITQKALQSALNNVRGLDLKLISAQEARRAIDRLVGYEISPVLWKKLGGKLSAGRVQSVALRLVVERERTIQEFAEKFSYRGSGEFITPAGEIIKATRPAIFADEAAARSYLQSADAKSFVVADVQTKPTEKTPPAPFTTSTLQQDGIKKFKWNAKKVMDVAQKLFESGHITYMRTDSPNLSEEAVAAIKAHVEANIGTEYFLARRFKSKESAQEAHEAIRPTHFENSAAGDDDDQQKLYRLIYTRALASQMAAARYQQTVVTIAERDPQDIYQAKASVLEFDGFLRVYQESDEEDAEKEETLTAAISTGDALTHQQLRIKQTYTMPPRRYDEATLVKDLENRGIGRPSTYASILANITNRQYVETATVAGRKVQALVLTWQPGKGVRSTSESVSMGGDKAKLVPTSIGNSITEFLEQHFGRMVDYEFTANVEEELDEIVAGKRKFIDVVSGFDTSHRQQIEAASQTVADAAPKEGASKLIGEYEGKPIRAGQSKFGTYIAYDGQFYNLQHVEPDQVTVDHLHQAMAQKQAAKALNEAGLIAKVGKKYEVRKGPYGIYITDGTVKASVRNKTEEEAAALLADECKEIIKGYLAWVKAKKVKS
ncbi:DNA topoisomerase I (plasmid) [Fibrisoma limi BUZ 3]|uniref:DNA topoisomerase 1 n=1 Tax=Fibrisoma limi BUZ 3 TaxID=1185876 RepID=I2GTY1_9BACT|nr:type I DNA topoisomerase [Fibrisoma limi]CCH57582.1 DNA topoisomerase I [Fibrisoma limi BUZ 3]